MLSLEPDQDSKYSYVLMSNNPVKFQKKPSIQSIDVLDTYYRLGLDASHVFLQR